MLSSICREYQRVNECKLEVDKFMGDADQATKSAIASLFPRARYLMCFFHVTSAVRFHYMISSLNCLDTSEPSLCVVLGVEATIRTELGPAQR